MCGLDFKFRVSDECVCVRVEVIFVANVDDGIFLSPYQLMIDEAIKDFQKPGLKIRIKGFLWIMMGLSFSIARTGESCYHNLC